MPGTLTCSSHSHATLDINFYFCSLSLFHLWVHCHHSHASSHCLTDHYRLLVEGEGGEGGKGGGGEDWGADVIEEEVPNKREQANIFPFWKWKRNIKHSGTWWLAGECAIWWVSSEGWLHTTLLPCLPPYYNWTMSSTPLPYHPTPYMLPYYTHHSAFLRHSK